MTHAVGTRSQVLRLDRRPVGAPTSSDWRLDEVDARDLEDGQFSVAVTHISIDPAMRGWMEDKPSYIPPVKVGSVMRATAVGRVLESRHPKFESGTLVCGLFGVRELAVSDGTGVVGVDPSLGPPESWLGVLGNTGMTAYFGLLEVGEPREGDTVVVSAAAGAVGSVVGQIAKIHGCRTIGIAGSTEKCDWLVGELGFDAAIDYNSEDFSDELAQHLPDGIDVFFDGVGGEILDEALLHLAMSARVVLCGAISQYNAVEAWSGPVNYWQLLVKRGRMQGFLAFDFVREFSRARKDLATWIEEGRLVARDEVIDGALGDFPMAFDHLFSGRNRGKVTLRLEGAGHES